ncbi:CAP domain-containing protein [Histidinibacterium lentulum]|nr:CAP domain-containing protein [Histidinibacterium lentulum]
MSIASKLERYVVKLVNEERVSRGLDPVRIEVNLNRSAEIHSQWMLDADVFSHTGAGGSTHDERIRDAGFDMSKSWRTGENLGIQSVGGPAGYYDELDAIHEGWMNSPGHKANILGNYDLIGVGVVIGAYTTGGTTYTTVAATQNFGWTTGQVDLDPGLGLTASQTASKTAPPPGNQILKGNATADILKGGAGHDVLKGFGGNDVLKGGAGNDALIGGGGSDALVGGAGNDRGFGGAGDDKVLGNAGNDFLQGQGGSDLLNGGGGDDALIGGGGDDTLIGGAGDDKLLGGGRNDVLNGGPGNDILQGHAGADRLYGGGGDDLLIGGGGKDRLDGGGGNDKLVGGGNADTFVFGKFYGNDTILDFENADLIEFHRSLWSGSARSLVDAARVTGDGVLFEFGGDSLLLLGVRNTDGLEDNISFI